VARTSNRPIIGTDYDGEFRHDRQPVGALQGTALDRVAYAGTASKTVGPALRLAWVGEAAAIPSGEQTSAAWVWTATHDHVVYANAEDDDH